MANTKKAVSEFNDIVEHSAELAKARADFASKSDEANHSKYLKQSAVEGYPDVHAAALHFQAALHATAKAGHTRGWQGGEQEIENLKRVAHLNNIEPGIFVTPEGAGSKREHILQLARLYGAKFLPGDGRSKIWTPTAHSFPSAESANKFASAVDHFYGESPEVKETPMVSPEKGDDGAPLNKTIPSWSVEFSHAQLGKPYPAGSLEAAHESAKARSSKLPHDHHVVLHPETGEHSVSLQPDYDDYEVVETYRRGKPVGPQKPKKKVDKHEREMTAEDELHEIRSLYLNSVRKSPSLMMEAIPVDANRGVTARGNSQHAKYMPQNTRDKMLQSYSDEIEAFARSRSIPSTLVFAAAESALKTGKVQNLETLGLVGDDAVAVKQFIISNVLNIQGLESTNKKSNIIEQHGTTGRHPMQPLGTYTTSGPLKFMKRRKDRRYPMGEEGGPYRTGGAPEVAPLTPTRLSSGPDAPVETKNFSRNDLLAKELVEKLKKLVGDSVHGMSWDEISKLARERGLLGTEESVSRANSSPTIQSELDGELSSLFSSQNKKTMAGAPITEAKRVVIKEHDYKAVAKTHGGKFIGYVQPGQGKYKFPNKQSAINFASHFLANTTAMPVIDGDTVSIDEPVVGESGHLGYAGTSKPDPRVHNNDAVVAMPPIKSTAKNTPTKKPEQTAKRTKDADPNKESWPKIGPELQKILNLEDVRFFSRKTTPTMPPESEIEEQTTSGSVGGFIRGFPMLTREKLNLINSYGDDVQDYDNSDAEPDNDEPNNEH